MPRALFVLLLAGVVAGAGAPAVRAQSRTVTGTVTSAEDGATLPGVNVVVAGTTTGTATNAAGVYRLDLPAGADSLVFSFIGFATVREAIAGRPRIDVELQPATDVLGDVVVVGYGEEARARVASSTSQVTALELAAIPVAGVDAALQGRAAGVQVIQNSGTPGTGISVRVRGHSSVDASNQPLYVVDGVPMLSEDFSQLGYGGQGITAVTNLSPSDIETVTILKDAAATAIYGSRGANGVVVITTRRGAAGRPTITYDVYGGSQSRIRSLDLMNAREYVTFMNEAALNDDPEDVMAYGDPDALAADTDWQDAVFQTAPIQSHSLSIRGGDLRTRYYVSASHFDQSGIVIGSGYDRTNLRANLDLTPSDRLFLETSLGLSREDNQRIENDDTIRGVLSNAIASRPTVPIYRPDGEFTGIDDGLDYINGIAVGTLNSGESVTYRALANVRADYTLTRGLHLNARLGADVLSLRENRYRSPRVGGDYAETVGGIAISGSNLVTRYLGEAYLAFDRAFGRHGVSATAGASAEANRSEDNYIRGIGLGDDYFRYVRNATTIEEFDGTLSEHNLLSFFSRATYSFADRYIATASLRTDGSSRFGPAERFGVFPAAALSWRVGQEPFVRRAAGAWLSDLKLRASYGLSGNQEIGNYTWRDRWGSAGYDGVPGLAPVSLENPGLTWETTAQGNLGFDLSLFRDRLSLTTDVYSRRTTSFLFDRPITVTSGFSSVISNLGEIRNAGVEMLLRGQVVRPVAPREFAWETTLNLSHYVNEVVALYEGAPFSTGQADAARVEEGVAVGSFYMLHFEGVDPATGDAIYEDVNGDGDITEADRRVVGSPHPDLYGSFTNALSFRGFDLNVFLLFSVGNEIFNAVRTFADDGGYSDDNMLRLALDRWQQPGDITDVPRASVDGTSGANLISDRFLEDGSFLRVKTVTLGYTLPERVLRSTGGRSLRLYVSAQNLFTFTRYTGLDPEVNYSGSSSNVVLGTDFYTFPQPRTLLLGATLSL